MKSKKITKFGIAIFLIHLMLIISLIPLLSAQELNNKYLYDGDLKKAIISDNLNNPVAEITLTSDYVQKVIRGKDRKVAEFIISSEKDYANVFKEMIFINNRNNKEFEREFKYKYKEITYENVIDYEYVCEEITGENKTTYSECNQVEVGNYNKEVVTWIELNKEVGLSKGNYTIGIFTDVYEGDNVEWIPTFYDIKIYDWAVWEESLGVDLWAYYNFEDGNGSTLRNVHNPSLDRNGTLENMEDEDWVSGIIGEGLIFDGNEYINFTGDDPFGGTNTSFTLSWWENRTNSTNFDATFGYLMTATVQPLEIVTNTGSSQLCALGSTDGVAWDIMEPILTFCGGSVTLGDWEHWVLRRDGINFTIYNDGVPVASRTDAGFFWNSGREFKLGAVQTDFFNGLMDEVGIWTRALSDSEINDLYNGGDGITFIDFNPLVTLIVPVDEFISNNDSVYFECNATDNIGILNLSLWIDSVRNITITNSSSGVNLTLQQLRNITEGIHTWTCKGTDNLNNVDWADSNRTLVVTNFTAPVEEEEVEGLLNIDLSQNHNLVLFIGMFILALFLFFIKLEPLAGFIITILGIMLIVSEYSIILGIFSILTAIFLLTMKRGDD